MQLASREQALVLWGARAYVSAWIVMIGLGAPVLVCAFIYNLVAPYNAIPAPLWAEVLLHVWLWLSVGLMVIASVLLLQIRCPHCGKLLVRSSRPHAESPKASALTLARVPWRRRISCGSCRCEYVLA